MNDLKVFAGHGSPEFAQRVCDHLKIPMGKMTAMKFANDNTFVRIEEPVRGCDVFLIQSLTRPVNDNLMELLVMLDAFRRASAKRITAVIPYYAYGRSDKKDQPRVPISARLVADLLTTAGANRVLLFDLHAGQIQGYFNVPVDELTAEDLLFEYVKSRNFENLCVVATDVGISKKARDLANRLDVPLSIIEKRRIGNQDKTETLNLIGDVDGMTALIFDDEIDTAGSLCNAAEAMLKAGAKEVYSCATHPVFSGPAIDRIAASPLKEVIVTDSVPIPQEKMLDKITVVSAANLFAEAIKRIHEERSIGELFNQ
ncbi:MAG: ribose-phosphate pyrophosphokinase [Dehalococcoidales bacterium]|nr:ribose-phosphate pyrophosphokinase [Dehalococcoidales bacterium]